MAKNYRIHNAIRLHDGEAVDLTLPGHYIVTAALEGQRLVIYLPEALRRKATLKSLEIEVALGADAAGGR